MGVDGGLGDAFVTFALVSGAAVGLGQGVGPGGAVRGGEGWTKGLDARAVVGEKERVL